MVPWVTGGAIQLNAGDLFESGGHLGSGQSRFKALCVFRMWVVQEKVPHLSGAVISSRERFQMSRERAWTCHP